MSIYDGERKHKQKTGKQAGDWVTCRAKDEASCRNQTAHVDTSDLKGAQEWLKSQGSSKALTKVTEKDIAGYKKAVVSGFGETKSMDEVLAGIDMDSVAYSMSALTDKQWSEINGIARDQGVEVNRNDDDYGQPAYEYVGAADKVREAALVIEDIGSHNARRSANPVVQSVKGKNVRQTFTATLEEGFYNKLKDFAVTRNVEIGGVYKNVRVGFFKRGVEGEFVMKGRADDVLAVKKEVIRVMRANDMTVNV